MTQRAYEELLKLKEQYGAHPSGLVFGGIKEVKRSFNTACRLTGIEDLHKHDLRHAFVTRSILAGIPPGSGFEGQWPQFGRMEAISQCDTGYAS